MAIAGSAKTSIMKRKTAVNISGKIRIAERSDPNTSLSTSDRIASPRSAECRDRNQT